MIKRNDQFRLRFDAHLAQTKLTKTELADRLFIERPTIYNYLKSSGPINYSFVLRTSAIFGLSGREMASYFGLAGYSVTGDSVPDMDAVWELADKSSASVAEKNEILVKYGYDAIG